MDRYDGSLYTAFDCFPSAGDEYAGLERIFAFNHPGGGTAQIILETPCADLDLIALQWTGWDDGDECPSEEHESRVRCYQERDDSDGVITLPLFENNEMPYIIIVDGVDGAEANFTLSATCP